jgi:eukaryotic-like serine/threonine-protein kinase
VKPARWRQIENLYNKALALDARQRSAFLREACGGDEDLQHELERLLEEDPQGSFLEKPALWEIAHEFAATAEPSWIGRQIGNYQFVSLVGAGGMGEVYRARDLQLKREVAVKILPEEFSHDPERVSRFQREAQLLASLNHPNIAAIYDLEEADGRRFLILELVEGETLADRIKRGPIPVEEALKIGIQIAEALEAAHEKNVIHRDLKPANIKVTAEGTVKVLDFGLAKLMGPADDGAPSLSNSPTLMTSMPGTILGTAAYMSPEQATGKEADRTSDVWAYGCVLYEMLSGHCAFPGDSVGEVLASVLKTEPDWQRLPADVPEVIKRLLRRCLRKDQKRRLRDIRDARLEIDEAQDEPVKAVSGAPELSRRHERLAWLSALALVAVTGAVVALWRSSAAPSTTPPPEMRVEISAPPTTDPTSLAISPDGQTLAFVATFEGQSHLWLRPFSAVSAHPLPETDGAAFPFWSPDSQSVAFFANGQLRQAGIAGGVPKTLANAPGGIGGTWSRNGVILFSTLGTPILRIPDRGGDPRPATRLGAQQGAHYLPQFLPDGRHFLYWAPSGREPHGVYVGQLDGSETLRLLDADFPAVYSPTDHLLFVRQGALLAQRFDRTRLALAGTPFPVAEQVTSSALGLRMSVSTSAAGPIAYRSGLAGGGVRQLTWFDRSGHQLGGVGAPFPSTQLSPALSPDGRRIALYRRVNGNLDVWLLDVERGVPTRFTFNSGDEGPPLWSRDGSRIVFNSNRKDVLDLYQKSASGAAGDEALLLQDAQNKIVSDWSPDGRFLLYQSVDPIQNLDIWALPLDGDKKPFPVVQTEFEEHGGQFSGDGRWIAYVSIKSGRYEVYVRPFLRTGDEIRISTDGGDQVRWRPDGKELFYIARDGQLVAVPIRPGSSSETVEAGSPVRLFVTRVGGWASGLPGPQYVVSPDGMRFLMNTLSEDVNTSPITVILNWKGKP